MTSTMGAVIQPEDRNDLVKLTQAAKELLIAKLDQKQRAREGCCLTN